MTAEGVAYITSDRFDSRKAHVYALVKDAGSYGITADEAKVAIEAAQADLGARVAADTGKYTGALSILHNYDGRVIRLGKDYNRGVGRGRSVYVLPEHVNGRPHFAPRPRKTKVRASEIVVRRDDLEALLTATMERYPQRNALLASAHDLVAHAKPMR